jgi:hypothetical protein
MVKKIQNNLASLKKIKVSSLNLILMGSVILINAIIVGLTVGFHTFRFNLEFLRLNVLQLIIISIVGISVFYFSYQQLTKKKPAFLLILAYVLLLGITIYNLSGLAALVENISGRGTFGITASLVTIIGILLTGLLLGRYDFPLIDSKEKLFISIEEHFVKNLGVYFVLFFIVAWASLLTGAFSYISVPVLVLFNVYTGKALLSNFRK